MGSLGKRRRLVVALGKRRRLVVALGRRRRLMVSTLWIVCTLGVTNDYPHHQNYPQQQSPILHGELVRRRS